jgi:hypothetical protein
MEHDAQASGVASLSAASEWRSLLCNSACVTGNDELIFIHRQRTGETR